MSWGNFQLVPGVVARLRLVFLSVSLVLITAMFLGYLQIKSLNSAARDLTEASFPVFVSAQETEHNLTALVLSLQAVELLRDLEELQPLSDALARQLHFLRQNMDQQLKRQITPETVVNMDAAVKAMKTSVNRMLDLKREMIGVEQAITLSASRLRERKTDILNVLKELSDENTATEITFRINTLTDMATRLDHILDLEEAAGIEDELRSGSSAISGLIGQLRPGPARQTLANEHGMVHNLIFGDAGIWYQAVQRQTLRAEYFGQNAEARALVAAISENSDTRVGVALSQVDGATQLLRSTVNRVVTFLMVASMASILVFGFANVLIVEKQINQRMSRLTTAVTAIATNQTDYDVDVEGDDELGEMARALATFKHTAKELRRSNIELEKFAYVAAHDLRSPLRAIQDLAEWTIEDEENQFSEDGRENMTLLQNRVNRLNQLLSDLLAYSRVGKEEEDLIAISLPQMVQETREMLDPNGTFDIAYSGISAEVITYATPVRQILLNLISNSIKHHDNESGKITITGGMAKNRLTVSVEDDGPGIELEYHDRIFGLFQTLRPRDEVEGSGLGLAIIRKLVEHYGGTIRLKSNPHFSRGTEFECDLPTISVAHRDQDMAA